MRRGCEPWAGTPDCAPMREQPMLVSQLAERIAERIRSGAYPAGSRLRQEALAQQFDVSRTPVREALQQLEARGLVVHSARQGVVVRTPSPVEIREAYLVRAELEGLAAELAAEWLTEEDFAALHAAQARYGAAMRQHAMRQREVEAAPGAEAEAPSNWLAENDAFHAVILRASGNARLRATVDELNAGAARSFSFAALGIAVGELRENIAQHDAIIAALERRDGVESRRVMAHHIRRSGEIFARWVERRAAEVPPE